jgi:uncharacterized membrane protein
MKKSEWLILIGLLLLSFVPSIGGIFRLLELGLGISLEFLPKNPRVQSFSAPVEFHLLSSIPYCIIGAFQFLPSIRRKHLKWHQLAGKFIIFAGLVSALSGLWMTHYYSFPESLQGELLYFVRLFVGVSMIGSILLGLSFALKKKISQHKAWMVRAYALGQGAGTQVIIAIPLLLIAGEEPTGFTRDILMTAAWVINIIIAEWCIMNA